METFVLIHGAHHGSWCWKMVTPLLEKAGYNVIAPDLPGHGENKKKAIEEITLNDYLDCIFEVLDRQPEPVILVGHSMGGLVISQVAEYRPNKIKKLVYLCAVLLKNGESLFKEESPPPDSIQRYGRGFEGTLLRRLQRCRFQVGESPPRA